MSDGERTIEDFVAERNRAKLLFTPGPASLLTENLTGLRPCFGRGDEDYARIEQRVLDSLREMSGHRHIVRMQGSASLALEIMALNFLYGRVLVVSTGYYSDRLAWLADSARRRMGLVQDVVTVDWNELASVSGVFDWVFACHTETSRALKIPIQSLHDVSTRTGARLMLDATASIGLEPGHDLADVIGYSSCKGLFGLTGAGFIAFNEMPSAEVDSFYLRLENHLERRMTGPYHAIASLHEVLPRHEELRAAVVENKRVFTERMAGRLTLPPSHQPLLCTHVDATLISNDPRAILYRPRGDFAGSVVCHLGEVHLAQHARGEILDVLHFADDEVE
jgi:aspartate aminotransferase-like enzyme